MKNTALTSDSVRPVVLSLKRKSLHNGTALKRNSGRNVKSVYEGPRMSRKVHSNINFSKLDEVCLDVGKVDLSFSARLRNDTGLSPQKGFRDTNGELHEVSFRSLNGHADYYTVYTNNRIELEKLKTIRSCYVQLEVLNQPKRRSFGVSPKVSSAAYKGEEDEDWKGWSSDIVFSEHHGCPVVEIKEDSVVSEVIVMSEDLVDCECKLLEDSRGYKLNRTNFKTVVLETCANSCAQRKSSEERRADLKEKFHELFADQRELQTFMEGMECSLTSPQKKTISRRLEFYEENDGVSGISNSNVQREEIHRSSAGVYSVANSDGVDANGNFLGYTDSAILTSKKLADRFLKYYKKVESQSELFL